MHISATFIYNSSTWMLFIVFNTARLSTCLTNRFHDSEFQDEESILFLLNTNLLWKDEDKMDEK